MNLNEYLQRRNLLFSKLADNSVTIIGSWPEQKLNGDVEYVYKQNPNLYYLTGWMEPHTILILEKNNESNTKTTMFVPSKDPSMEVWTGKRNGPEGAVSKFGVDEAYDNTSFKDMKNQLMLIHSTIYYDCPDNNSNEWNSIMHMDINKIDLAPIIELQRVKKTGYEVDVIRRSCQLSAKAHMLAMMSAHPGMNECQLDGLINGYLMWHGDKRLAYPNIVASGNNATTLHYDKNDDIMEDGELVLIDSGGELEYYASDITRTFPVNGKFTKEQAEIYQIVLDAQQSCIDYVKPGITVWDLHELSCRVIVSGLLKIGLLFGTIDDNIKNESYKKFYMHNIGHWMGIDVHDCKSVDRKTVKLEPGFVFTVEPGIYISNDSDVPDAYRGIGVRIEDDVVVTVNGCEVLSKDVPKEIPEIEKLVGIKQMDVFM